MTVRIACGLSTASDPHAGAIEAAATVAAELHGANIDLAVVFASGGHLAAPEATIEGVHDVLAPDVLVGCGAGGIVGGGREIEGGTAVTVWAASFEDGAVSTFHAEVQEVEDGVAISGVPDLSGAGGAILLPDPYSFPTDAVLSELHERSPGVPVLGGVASARTLRGEAALFLGEEIVSGGAIGVRFDGVELLPCVSQGATPIGPELTITAGEGRIIHELAGRPALAALRSVIEDLGDDERRILAEGMLLGIVVESGRPDYLHGDFLVRSVLGGDPETGTIAVGAPISTGQVVRVHARDAASADRDLHDALGLRRQALGTDLPAGALMFTCNGRGRGMFGVPDHDMTTLTAELGAIPTAGFFAAGEIGPVGGESFLHGFTATVAVFAPVNVAGRSALVTGASGGLGHAIARRLAAAGASLVLSGRRADVLEELAAELGAQIAVADLADADSVRALAEAHGDVDILVANAGLPASGRLQSFSEEQIDRALLVNLRAPILLAHAIAPAMVARGLGHIVLMSSLSGKAPAAGSSIYSATKFGLRGFAGALRAELHGSGVGVSAIFPGFIRDAGMFEDAGVALPRGTGTKTPQAVAKATLRAIERNKGEIDVAPIALKVGATISGIAPELAATVTRKAGGDEVAAQFEAGQLDKR